MAIAETADLAVRLSLNDKQFGDAINRIDRRLGAFSGAVNRNLSRAIDYGAQRAARALVGAFRGGIDELRALEVATAQTEAVIKSTGGTAGVTADEVRNLAEKYEDLNAIIDDKAIQSAQNLLLTFTNIREEAFEPTLQASLDMATALGTDVSSAAKTLGRALQDPEKGMGRLERSIGPLDEALKDQIKSLTEQGDLLGAQKLLLDEVGRRYGGSFARQGDTAAASQARLTDKIDEVQKAFAQRLLPVVVKVSDKISDYLAKPETIAFFDRLGETVASLFTDENLDTAAAAIETAASAVGTAITAFNALPPEIKALAIGALTLNKITGGAVGGAAEAFGKLLGAGLKQIFAAHVTVVGKTVTGGGVGVPGAGGGSSRLGRALGATAIVAEVAAPIITAIQISEESSSQAAGLQNQLLADIAAKTPEDLSTALQGVEQGIRDLESNPLTVLVRGDALDTLKSMRDAIKAEQARDASVTGERGVSFRESERASGLEGKEFNAGVNRLQAKLSAAIRQESRAERRGNDRNARQAGNKVDRLRERLAQRIAAEGNQTQNLQRNANGKLGTIAKKDLSVRVNVSNPISVATYVRGMAVSTRYGGNFSVTAT